MEESLQNNVQLLQNVVNNASDSIAVYLGEELKIIIANQAMIKSWGKGNDVVGKLYTDLLPELENQNLFDQAISVLKSGIPLYFRNSRIDIVVDGVLKEHYFNYSFIPLNDVNGTTYAVMNTATDTTDLIEAQYKIQETEEKFHLAIDAGGLGTYISNLITSEVVTSEGFNQIWGIEGSFTRDDIVSKIVPEDLTIRKKAHEKAAITGVICYEVRVKRDDLFRWVRVTGKIVKNDTGNPEKIIGVVQDITAQKEFSEELKKRVEEQTAELKKSNENLVHFANIVSHDLKEPVRKINIFNNLLRNDLEHLLNEKCLSYFEKVNNSTQRMTSIIEGVLNYSTLNKTGYPVEPIDINIVIEGIKTDLELIFDEKKAILIKENLPEIDGAPILIHQLFYNLIHNALKFSTGKPPKVIITSSVVKIDNTTFAKIIIKDNGIGFDPIYAEKIFDAFERLNSKDVFEGTGLGLSLCKKIVERHNGTIEASGKQNDGAEFIVCLPLKQHGNKI